MRKLLFRRVTHYIYRHKPKDGLGCRVLKPWSDNASYRSLLYWTKYQIVVMDEELWTTINKKFPDVFHVVVCEDPALLTHPKGIRPNHACTTEEFWTLFDRFPKLSSKQLIILGGTELFLTTLPKTRRFLVFDSEDILPTNAVLRPYPVELMERLSFRTDEHRSYHINNKPYRIIERSVRLCTNWWFKRCKRCYDVYYTRKPFQQTLIKL